MKKIVAFSLLLAGGQYATASEVIAENDNKAGHGYGGLSGMMLGAAAGGPIGAVAGAVAGIFTGHQVQEVSGLKADENTEMMVAKLADKSSGNRLAAKVDANTKQSLN